MASLQDLPLSVRLFLKVYPWRRIDPVPWTPLRRPLSECRLGLVSSAGFVASGQAPFDETVRGGDFTHREIPGDIQVETLTEHHRSESFDHTGLLRDPNLAFPIDRLRELVAAGRLGGLAPRHWSFMGSLTATARFMRDTAPAIGSGMSADAVDVALLVPV